MRVVRKYSQGYLAFTRGKFDDWAVYVKYPGMPTWPTDKWYFLKLKVFALYGPAYDDFITLYERVTAEVDDSIFDWIDEISIKYPKPEEAAVVFGIYYMTMIAEENKAGAILKKRIKRLGVHQVLKEGMKPDVAANWSRGKSAMELVMECHNRGF